MVVSRLQADLSSELDLASPLLDLLNGAVELLDALFRVHGSVQGVAWCATVVVVHVATACNMCYNTCNKTINLF